jgi:hypothetical protein
MYRLIHHGYAGLPSKEAWFQEKDTSVTIPWELSKLKPMLAANPSHLLAYIACTELLLQVY